MRGEVGAASAPSQSSSSPPSPSPSSSPSPSPSPSPPSSRKEIEISKEWAEREISLTAQFRREKEQVCILALKTEQTGATLFIVSMFNN